MAGSVHVRGGFGSDYEQMSDSLRARIASADAQHERQVVAEQHQREERDAALQERNVVASILAAQERGELVDVRKALRDGGVGRTHAEIVSYAAAQADVEDMRAEAAERAEFRRWQEGQTAATSADTSAPTPSEVAEGEVIAGRNAAWEARRQLLGQARYQAQTDLDARIQRMRVSPR